MGRIKYVFYIAAIALAIFGCAKSEYDLVPGAPGQTGQVGADGQDGKDGASATITFSLAQIECESSMGTRVSIFANEVLQNSFDVCNGSNGQDGSDGQDGQDGEDGEDSDVEIASYSSSSCTSIGSGKYYKSSGSNAKIYTNSSCSGGGSELNDAQSTQWLDSDSLAIFNGSGSIKVLNF